MKPPSPLLEVLSNAAEPDPEMEALFFAARESAEPAAESRERVSQALRAALPGAALSAAAPGASAPAAAAGSALVQAAARAPQAAKPAGVIASRWLLVGGIGIGALGFWLGRDVGYGQGLARGLEHRLAESVAPAASVAPVASAALPARSAAPSNGELATPGAIPSAPSSEEGDRAATAEAFARATAEPRAERARARRARPTTPGAQRAADARLLRRAAPATASTPGLGFREALEQLRRAQQLLHNGQAAASLLLLSELDRNAGELLLEERETTRVLALCGVGQEKAARAAATLLRARSPRSIYAMRLEHSCIADDGIAEGNIAEGSSSEHGAAVAVDSNTMGADGVAGETGNAAR